MYRSIKGNSSTMLEKSVTAVLNYCDNSNICV